MNKSKKTFYCPYIYFKEERNKLYLGSNFKNFFPQRKNVFLEPGFKHYKDIKFNFGWHSECLYYGFKIKFNDFLSYQANWPLLGLLFSENDKLNCLLKTYFNFDKKKSIFSLKNKNEEERKIKINKKISFEKNLLKLSLALPWKCININPEFKKKIYFDIFLYPNNNTNLISYSSKNNYNNVKQIFKEKLILSEMVLK